MLPGSGSENRESSENCGTNEFRESTGIFPGDVARGVFGPNAEGAESLKAGRAEIAKIQRQIISAAGILPIVAYPGSIDAKGTEHVVRFRGLHVEKHQHSDGWAPAPVSTATTPNALPPAAPTAKGSSPDWLGNPFPFPRIQRFIPSP